VSTEHTFKRLHDAEVHDDLIDAVRAVDAFGRSLPRKLGLFPLLRVAVQAGVRYRSVPEDFWAPASDAESHELQAVVNCQCGQVNIVPVGRTLLPCPGCERWFFYAGAEVLAFNSPQA
jgi:hypothetical protein